MSGPGPCHSATLPVLPIAIPVFAEMTFLVSTQRSPGPVFGGRSAPGIYAVGLLWWDGVPAAGHRDLPVNHHHGDCRAVAEGEGVEGVFRAGTERGVQKDHVG